MVLFFFSFVEGYWMAVIGRFILGMVSGLSPICKAALTEILPKSRNAEAIGYASAVWYLGNFAGPFIGGNTLFLLDSQFILPSLMSCFIVFASWYLIKNLFFETNKVDDINRLGTETIKSIRSKVIKEKRKNRKRQKSIETVTIGIGEKVYPDFQTRKSRAQTQQNNAIRPLILDDDISNELPNYELPG